VKQLLLGLAVLACCPIVAAGQQPAATSGNPISETTREIINRYSKNMVAAAEEMPADKYSYKPTPDQMTFGHIVMHVAQSNNFLCSKISGTPAPEGAKLSDTDPKDQLVAAIKASFDYCTTALAKTDDSDLGQTLALFGGRSVPRGGVMMILTDDFADHYAAEAMYLRLNGLLPPTAKKRD
jgi:hypothetical protein